MDSIQSTVFPLPLEAYSVAPTGAESGVRSAEPAAEEEEIAVDRVTLSDEAIAAARALQEPRAVQAQEDAEQRQAEEDDDDHEHDGDDDDHDHGTHMDEAGSEQDLTQEEQAQLAELQATDQRVRAHEQAHAAAGAYNVRYDYQTGPDGKQYAVGGSAQIATTTNSSDPDGRIAEARKMRNAALAPADPSSEDMAVAAKATRIEMEAQVQKLEEQVEEQRQTGDEDEAGLRGEEDVANISGYGEILT